MISLPVHSRASPYQNLCFPIHALSKQTKGIEWNKLFSIFVFISVIVFHLRPVDAVAHTLSMARLNLTAKTFLIDSHSFIASSRESRDEIEWEVHGIKVFSADKIRLLSTVELS